MDRRAARRRGRAIAGATLCLGLCLGPVAVVPCAAAQPIAPLDRYDLAGDRTIDALRFLRAATPSGAGVASEGSRLDAVRGATDLWLIAFLDPDHDGLEDRVARALGVPRDAVVTELRLQLESLERGHSAIVEELRSALTLARAIATDGNEVSFAGTRGLRRDALLIDAVARAIAIGDGSALAAMIGDPCAGEAPCAAPWSGWAASSRARIAALVEGSAAAMRLAEAASSRDPFAVAVTPTLADATRTIVSHVVRPVPRLPDDLPCGISSYDDEMPTNVEVIVAVARDHVTVSRVSPVRAVDGVAVLVDEGGGASPGASIALAIDDRPRAILPLVDRLREMRLPDGARVAVAAADDVPVVLLGRTLTTIASARLTPSVLARRAPDGTLRGVEMRLLAPRSVTHDGDLLIQAHDAGYVVTSGRERMLQAPNEEALWHRLHTVRGRRVILDANGTAPVAELYDAAFRMARGGGTVSIVAP